MTRPPGDVDWKESPAQIGGAGRRAFLATFTDNPVAQTFVDEQWDSVHAAGGAIFVHHLPSILGEPTMFTPTGPCYRPTPQPPEVWFVPEVSFTDVWAFAKPMGFVTPALPQSLAEDCDAFLRDLASRHPIGVEEVGESMAMFRRYKDGGAFSIAEMRRACELNVAVLGAPRDESHNDKSMPRHFVKMGFFYFGM